MTASTALLTVGIPTFNRSTAVARRAEELGALADDLDIEVVISDNASPDGTFDRLQRAKASPRIRVVKNETNLGYAGNVFRVVDEASTPYLLLVSDEDRVDAAGLRTLIDFCRSRQPEMVSPRAKVGANSAYRGRTSTRIIKPEEFQSASFYVSGLTFATESVQKSAATVRGLVPENSAATVYPQVLISALTVARGDSYFLDALVTEQVDELATAITEPSGAGYTTIAGRWAQHRGYEQFFALDHAALVGGQPGIDALHVMREHMREELLSLLLRAGTAEAPQLAPYFDRAIRRSALRTALRRKR